jgi:hypothetical protein
VAACGGVPVAIRIAGAKLVLQRHLTITRYATRLGDEHRLLGELATGDLDIRDWLARSFQDLLPGDLIALGRLAGRAGPEFAPAEAAELLGTTTAHAEATLERLSEAHCATARTVGVSEPGTSALRYRLPVLVRAFAAGHWFR